MTNPSTILLPTDFTGRCDRSRDRAVQLARCWGAKLVLMHVLSDGSGSGAEHDDDIVRAQSRLRNEVRDDSIEVVIHTAAGDIAQAILDASATFEADLIVTGISRRDGLGDYIVGSTVERVARASRLPVLVVKETAAQPYRSVMVATDFSSPSAAAFHAAVAMFPAAQFWLVHAYHVRLEALRGREGPAAAQQAEIAAELEAFLAALELPPEVRENLDINVDYGDVCQVARDHVQTNESDLAVVGARGRSGLVSTVLGSTARALVECLECDVLMVPQKTGSG